MILVRPVVTQRIAGFEHFVADVAGNVGVRNVARLNVVEQVALDRRLATNLQKSSNFPYSCTEVVQS